PCSRIAGATTSATAQVAAEIMAGRPPTTAMVIGMMKEENRPTFGSTPAMMEKEIASGISASATTRPASISRIRIFGVFNAVSTEGSGRYRSLSCVGEVTLVMELENYKSNAE